MAFDAHKNFAYSTVLTAPSPATSGTSLGIQASDGAGFPAVSFNAVVWPAAQLPTRANAEIVRVTANAADVFTITRAQESSVARSIIVGDQIAACITLKTLTDIEAGTNFPLITTAGAVTGGTVVATTTVTAGSGVLASSGRFTGISGLPVTGEGLEFLYLSSTGVVQAYDRNGGAYKAVALAGLTVDLQISGVSKAGVGATGGFIVGAPTGGEKGTGTINTAGDIYKNNTAFTNPQWALKHAFNNGVVDADGPYAAPAWYRGRRSIDDHRAFVAKQFDLPLMAEEPEEGLFRRGDLMLASLEEAYLYIYDLHDRLTALEQRLGALAASPGVGRALNPGASAPGRTPHE